MALTSSLFAGDDLLNAALTQDASHILPGSVGPHVLKLQAALELLERVELPADEKDAFLYGPATADAVQHYKAIRRIINTSIQAQADNIVGKRTIAAMDAELQQGGTSRATRISVAHRSSRASLLDVQARLIGLQEEIEAADNLPEPNRSGEAAAISITHARDLQVLARRLVLSEDPLDPGLRDGLRATIGLVTLNLAQPISLVDEGTGGRCTGRTDFAVTFPGGDPHIAICEPYFAEAEDLQRDVITHENFHLAGLGLDHSVSDVAEALTNANTIAQIVAFLFDRDRQLNSDGFEPAVPPFDSP